MPVIITHPTGNQFFREAAKGFQDAGILHSIYTSVAGFPGSLFYSLSKYKPFEEIKRRTLNNSFKNITRTHPYREIGRLLAVKTKSKTLTEHEKGIFSVDAVYKSLDNCLAKNLNKENGVTAVYAYEDGAAFSFEKAKQLNISCLYDLPIGYWRSMHAFLKLEKEINPAWSSTLNGLKDSEKKLQRKDCEIEMADLIITASSFTANTLKLYPGKLPEIKIIPYGFPTAERKTYTGFNGRKLKLLFVGGLSQRKGLSYLFEAVRGLENVTSLTVVGRTSGNYCEPLAAELKKHIWIESLPHIKILQLMREHDILVFPSLFEGFGQVITEAMAQGTPVITTERTAGPDLIKNNENGWLINAGSAAQIKTILEQVLFRPDVIEEVGTQAYETAKLRPWSKYRFELAESVKNFV